MPVRSQSAGLFQFSVPLLLTPLKDPARSVEDRRFALRFLIHLVQDLHMPLHVGDNHDKERKGDSDQIWRIQEKEKETATSNRGQPTSVSWVFHGAESSIPAPIAWPCPWPS